MPSIGSGSQAALADAHHIASVALSIVPARPSRVGQVHDGRCLLAWPDSNGQSNSQFDSRRLSTDLMHDPHVFAL